MVPAEGPTDGTTRRISGAVGTSPHERHVVVIIGGVVTTHVLPESGSVTFGRAPGCTVRIDDSSVSRRHAVLHVGSDLVIEDLGSANGTRVRGVPLRRGGPVPVVGGELIELGSAMVVVQQEKRLRGRAHRVWTHGYFEGRLEEECGRAARSSSTFAVLRIHADRPVPVGILEESLSSVLRDDDVLASYGPGEHELLLPETSLADAERIERAIAARLDAMGLGHRIGLTSYPQDGTSAHQLLSKACAGTTRDPPRPTCWRVVIANPAMKSLYHLIERIAASPISVLILGETGVGKELVADAIHHHSQSAAGPLSRINCAALPESLLEAELFGYERGAFTGATQAKPGLLEAANGGTVFLDEIGEMPTSVQIKLLRVLEDRTITRIGSRSPRRLDVRFVSATNRDLEHEIARGGFRQDLFFRLNGISVTVPPLRDRVDEIEELAQVFIADFCRRAARDEIALSREALELLKGYDWPGNIRELRNVVERAVLFASGTSVEPGHLPVEKLTTSFTARPATPQAMGAARPDRGEPAPEPATANGMRREIEDVARQHIVEALRRTAGNQTLAARILGISRRTLCSKIVALEIQRPRKKR